jgi:hypothetical protein
MWTAVILIILYLLSVLATVLIAINETVKKTDWAVIEENHRNFLIAALTPLANIALMVVILTDKEK